MREFKFRAWSKDRNAMLQVGDDFGTDHPLDCVVYARQRQNVILMQYTGLKDRNGKEIYEGDIVKSFGKVGLVEWLNGHYEIEFGDYESYLWECSRETIEVIGNEYENPELLEPNTTK